MPVKRQYARFPAQRPQVYI